MDSKGLLLFSVELSEEANKQPRRAGREEYPRWYYFPCSARTLGFKSFQFSSIAGGFEKILKRLQTVENIGRDLKELQCSCMPHKISEEV